MDLEIGLEGRYKTDRKMKANIIWTVRKHEKYSSAALLLLK